MISKSIPDYGAPLLWEVARILKDTRALRLVGIWWKPTDSCVSRIEAPFSLTFADAFSVRVHRPAA